MRRMVKLARLAKLTSSVLKEVLAHRLVGSDGKRRLIGVICLDTTSRVMVFARISILAPSSA
jgi:hypothetical protein